MFIKSGRHLVYSVAYVNELIIVEYKSVVELAKCSLRSNFITTELSRRTHYLGIKIQRTKE